MDIIDVDGYRFLHCNVKEHLTRKYVIYNCTAWRYISAEFQTIFLCYTGINN
jgi:hypothetical protein